MTGSQVLDEAAAFVSRFAVFPSEAARDAVVLWAAHTHAVNAFNASPRLAVLSEGPASGKTRVLELVGMLSRDPCQEIDVTGPALVALMDQRQPTVLMDEVDTIWGTHGGSSHASLRSVLNAGYKSGSTVSRRSGGTYLRSRIYGPIAFGGLGTLPPALLTRCVVIRMTPRKPEDIIESYYPRLHQPMGYAIGEALGSWVTSVTLDLASAWPTLPDGVQDRPAEIWESLLAVADAAGGTWPDRARAACVELVLGNRSEITISPGERILADLRDIWKPSEDKLPTAEIITRLFALPGAPWASMWSPESAPRELSALLAVRMVRPVKIRVKDRTMQGYRRADFAPLWPEVRALCAATRDARTPEAEVPAVPDVPAPEEKALAAVTR
jgi:Protein of unknown function (DUF3631)